jgi:hypothetical protein
VNVSSIWTSANNKLLLSGDLPHANQAMGGTSKHFKMEADPIVIDDSDEDNIQQTGM